MSVAGIKDITFPDSIEYTPGMGWLIEECRRYEQKVIAFLSLKATINTDDFCLITKPPKCEPFNDVILCTKQNNQNIVYLFQLKNELNPDAIIPLKKLISNNVASKFYIGRLYDGYSKGIIEVKRIIPEYYSERCIFKIIIFTKSRIQCEIFDLITEENLLFTASHGKTYKFNSAFLAEEVHCDKREFLQLINVYAEQWDIDNTSIGCIKKFWNSEDDIAELIKFEYFICVRNWCEIKQEKYCITKEFIYRVLTYATFKHFAISIDDYSEIIYKQYPQGNLVWEAIKINNLSITPNHIQYVLGKALEDFLNLDVDEQVLLYFEEIISASYEELQATSRKQIKYFVGCLLGKLPFIVKNFNLAAPKEFQFKIIFIGPNETGRQGALSEIDEGALAALKQESITTSSGQHFKVGDIIDGLLEETTISDVLSLVVDFHGNSKNQNTSFVERKLSRILFEKNVFAVKNDIFIINTNGISTEKFIKYFDLNENNVIEVKDRIQTKFKIYENLEVDFKYLNKSEINTSEVLQGKILSIHFDFNQKSAADNSERQMDYKYFLINNVQNVKFTNTPKLLNVHYFQLLRNGDLLEIEWLSSIGNIENIRKFESNKSSKMIFLDKRTGSLRFQRHCYGICNCCVLSKEILHNFQNSLLLIVGPAGIGKTVLLKQFCQNPSTNDLVLFVTLRDHCNYFEMCETNIKSKSAKEHLLYFSKNENTIFTKFVMRKVQRNEIIILLDGFNEVVPRYTNIVSKIITEIKDANFKIILTTRGSLKNKLENLFETFAFSLVPFNSEDAEKLLLSLKTRFYKSQIRRFLEIDEEFFRIPLNIQLFYNYIDHEFNFSHKVPKNITFQEYFLNRKLEIYCDKIKTSNISKTAIERYHKYFSIRALFSKLSYYHIIQDSLDLKLNDYIYEFRNGEERVGILLVDDEVFINRSVAEFFVAGWLVDVYNPSGSLYLLQGEKEFAKFIMNLVNFAETKNCDYDFDVPYFMHLHEFEYRHRVESSFPFIKFLFNQLINQNELHKAAFKGNYKYLKDNFDADIKTVYTLNKFNRTLLFTTISNNELYFKDKLEGNEYLFKVLNILFTNFKDILIHKDFSQTSIKDFIEVKQSTTFKLNIYKSYVYCNQDFSLWQIFDPESLHESLQSLQVLHECDVFHLLNILQENKKIYTILDAAKHGHLSVIKYFVDIGTKTNIKNPTVLTKPIKLTSGATLNIKEPPVPTKHTKLETLQSQMTNFLESSIEKSKLYEMLTPSDRNRKSFGTCDKLAAIMALNDEYRRSILHYATISGNLELIRYLLENKVNLESSDRDGLSAFHYAAIFNRNSTVIEYYMTQGYHFHTHNFDSTNYPIQYAAAFCNRDTFDFLIANGAIMNCKSSKEETLIHLITVTNSFVNKELQETLTYNYSSKLDNHNEINTKLLNIKNEYNVRCFEFIKLLIEKGIDVNSTTRDGFTPLAIAIYLNNDDLTSFLLKFAQVDAALHSASLVNNITIINLLLNKYNIDVNKQDSEGFSALHYAVAAKNLQTVEFLIKAGANVDIPNAQGTTPLHVAAEKGLLKIIKLLSQVADVNTQNHTGNTALHYAIFNNHTETAKYLIESGANIDLLNNEEAPALLILAYEKYQLIRRSAQHIPSKKSMAKISPKHIETKIEHFIGDRFMKFYYDIFLETSGVPQAFVNQWKRRYN